MIRSSLCYLLVAAVVGVGAQFVSIAVADPVCNCLKVKPDFSTCYVSYVPCTTECSIFADCFFGTIRDEVDSTPMSKICTATGATKNDYCHLPNMNCKQKIVCYLDTTVSPPRCKEGTTCTEWTQVGKATSLSCNENMNCPSY